jgi:hypothetical protein
MGLVTTRRADDDASLTSSAGRFVDTEVDLVGSWFVASGAHRSKTVFSRGSIRGGKVGDRVKSMNDEWGTVSSLGMIMIGRLLDAFDAATFFECSAEFSTFECECASVPDVGFDGGRGSGREGRCSDTDGGGLKRL